MSRVDVHPEELLDAARRGELDASELRRLEAHVAHCTACAMERAAMADFDREMAPRDGDDAVTARLVAGVLARAGAGAAEPELEHPPSRPSSATSGATSPRRRPVVVIAAAALVVGLFGGAAAALWAVAPLWDEPATAPPEEAEPVQPAAGTRHVPARSESDGPPEDEAMEDPESGASTGDPAVDVPAVTAPVAESSAPERPARVTSDDGDHGDDGAAERPSAEELLARANEARRRGELRGAARLYRLLQRSHPSSREASVSRVTLGRLLLDGLGEAGAALPEFDRYLQAHPSGVLAEEARVGRALALGRLGREAEERAAWRELLAHHPDSLHADRARSRLE